MIAAGGIAMLLFIGTCSTVGVRILLLFLKTRGAAELYCGLGFLLIGLLGYPSLLASGVGRMTVGEANIPLHLFGMAATCSGIGFFYAFTAAAFRGKAPWTQSLTWASASMVGTSFFGTCYSLLTADPSMNSYEVVKTWSVVLQVPTIACFAWTAYEGFLQWGMARRRVAIGVGNPLIANRFLLWGSFGAATLLLTLLFSLAQLLGIVTSTHTALHTCAALLGSGASLAVYLSFFPPKRYEAFIRARAAAAE